MTEWLSEQPSGPISVFRSFHIFCLRGSSFVVWHILFSGSRDCFSVSLGLFFLGLVFGLGFSSSRDCSSVSLGLLSGLAFGLILALWFTIALSGSRLRFVTSLSGLGLWFATSLFGSRLWFVNCHFISWAYIILGVLVSYFASRPVCFFGLILTSTHLLWVAQLCAN